jgi:hypothetical protein
MTNISYEQPGPTDNTDDWRAMQEYASVVARYPLKPGAALANYLRLREKILRARGDWVSLR